MRQLVELQKHADDFRRLNATLVFVYREEAEGIAGLQKIQARAHPDFKLGLDFQKKSSQAYSPGKLEFDNYVIDSSGKIRGIVDGTLRVRAHADELMKLFREIENVNRN